MGKLVVYFVKCNETSEITACFLNTQGKANSDNYIECYSHIGQHGTAYIRWVFDSNTQATKQEYSELYKELLRVGYKETEIEIFNYKKG